MLFKVGLSNQLLNTEDGKGWRICKTLVMEERTCWDVGKGARELKKGGLRWRQVGAKGIYTDNR